MPRPPSSPPDTRRRPLFFGGTFNPVHHGHLICARAAAEAAGFGPVVLVPSAQPPHRDDFDLLPAALRLELCQLAVAGDGDFRVSDVEHRRGGPSYTVETVAALAGEVDKRVAWLIGADQLATLPNWHRADELAGLASFVVMRRPGHVVNMAALPAAWRRAVVAAVETPHVEISATQIRARLRANLSIRHLVPEPVRQRLAAARAFGGGA